MELYLKYTVLVISLLMSACFVYQGFYILVSWFKKPVRPQAGKLHHYGVLIAARNEEKVIGGLIESIQNQDYPQELLDIYVVADNCTDKTAQAAREAGAYVYERFNQVKVGKGYALNELLNHLFEEKIGDDCEGYFIFDADNLLAADYVKEMNGLFDHGYRIVTSYRNSKNFGDNWISAGYGLWFLREAKYVNNARMILGTSCAVSGTGYLVHQDILREKKGWDCYLLTEDIQFSAQQILEGERIGYCSSAVFYDEQPTGFTVSFYQRLRWTRGILQVFFRYGKELAVNIVKKGSFACYDMLMFLLPTFALFLSCILGGLSLVSAFLQCGLTGAFFLEACRSLGMSFLGSYGMMFALGAITMITEWKQIYCTRGKKIFYMFTFPIYMATYIPIAFVAAFKKISWKPVPHSVVKTVKEVKRVQ